MVQSKSTILGGKIKKHRKGVHAKKRSSKSKTSKNYLKRYRGQGK